MFKIKSNSLLLQRNSVSSNIKLKKRLRPCKMAEMALGVVLGAMFLGCFPAKAEVISELMQIIPMAESSNRAWVTDGQSHGLCAISKCVLTDFNRAMAKKGVVAYGRLKGRMCQFNSVCITGVQYYKLPFTEKDLFNAEINKIVAEWYLRWIQSQLPKEYKQSKAHIISSYNNGIGWLKKRGWKPPKSHKNKIYNGIYQHYWGTQCKSC